MSKIQLADYVQWAYGLFRVGPSKDDLEREIFITSYQGAYGIAGYVITINGSPPRVTVIVEPSSHQMIAMGWGRMIRGEGFHHYRPSGKRFRDAVEWVEKLSGTTENAHVGIASRSVDKAT